MPNVNNEIHGPSPVVRVKLAIATADAALAATSCEDQDVALRVAAEALADIRADLADLQWVLEDNA